ncbi:MAG: methyl-accepting chemotaxis protein [Leptospiraceae bacterium]|nr:methyl-accepting chemotaxis protein [Leptospiraceae bacterium]
MKLSIKKKILLSFAITFTLGLLILVGLSIRIEIQNQKESIQKELKLGVSSLRLFISIEEGNFFIKEGKLWKGEKEILGLDKTLIKMKKNLGMEFSVYIEDIRYATTLTNSNGESLVGKKCSEIAKEKVLERAEVLFFQTLYEGEDFYLYVEPILDANNKVIGMLKSGLRSKIENKELISIILIYLGVFGLLLFLGGFTLYKVLQRLFRPVEQIKEVILKVSEGDLQIDIVELESNDEIRNIFDSLNLLALNLSGILTSIKYYSEEIGGQSIKLKENSENLKLNSSVESKIVTETSNSLTEMFASMKEIISNLQTNNESISNMTNTLNKLETSGQEISMIMKELSNSANYSNQKVLSGNESIQEAISSIEIVKNKTSQITEFVTIITEISDLTNLLSLNASIEAARAGESGRGFAVVATEITKLASKTIQSVKEVKLIISEVLKSVNQAVEKVESSSQKLDEISEVVLEIDNKVNKVAYKIHEQDTNTSSILDSSKLLTKFSSSVLENIVELEKVTHSIESNMDFINDAASQNNESSKELFELSNSLKEESLGLTQIVGSFKL